MPTGNGSQGIGHRTGGSKVTIEEKLLKVLEHEMKLSHLELHGARLAFFKRVWDCANRDISFRELVSKQFELYVGIPDSRDLYAHINSPRHVIRNRLLSWAIDHPELEEVK